MLRRCLYLVSCILIIILLGCARLVTPIITYGDQMEVTVTLRGTMEVNSSRYFMVISSTESYKIPLPSPDIIEAAPEFIEPGMTPHLGTEEAYYSHYFSTWSGYIILDPGGYYLIRGPFVISQTNSREVVSALDDIDTKITFSFRLGRIFDTVPDKIYFDFITVPWSEGSEKMPADHLPSTGNYISKVSGSILNIDDETNNSLDASLDIIKCRVKVE